MPDAVTRVDIDAASVDAAACPVYLLGCVRPKEVAARPSQSRQLPSKSCLLGSICDCKYHRPTMMAIQISGGAAPFTGLWRAKAPETYEDVAHMKSRFIQFNALTPIDKPLQ